MSPEIISSLAQEIAKQAIETSWPYFLFTICFSGLCSALAAYGGSYLTKRGETRALKVDFAEIKRQQQESTALTEEIKVEIHRFAQRSDLIEGLKREKVEAYMEEIFKVSSFLSDMTMHHFFRHPKLFDRDPLDRATMLQSLYLHELDVVHALLIRSTVAFREWISEGMDLMLKTGALAPPADHLAQLRPKLETVQNAVAAVNSEVRKLAKLINVDHDSGR